MKAWAVILACIFTTAAWAHNDPEPIHPLIGEVAPGIAFTSEAGVVETTNHLFETDALILLFATSESANAVIALQSELASFADEGLPVLIIDIDCFTTRRDAAALWAGHGLIHTLRFDDGGLASLYQVGGVPYAALIDRDGILRYLGGLGRKAEERKLFIKLLEELISGTRLSAQTLPVAEPGYSHLPNCRGLR